VHGVEAAEDRRRQPARFRAEEQGRGGFEAHRSERLCALSGEGVDRQRLEFGQAGLERGMNAHRDILVIVESGTPECAILEVKAERFDEVEARAGIGAQAYNIARVRWDFRFQQDDFEHGVRNSGIGLQMNDEAQRDPRLAIDFCGLALSTPLVLLSGCVGFGEEYTRVAGFSNADVGAVCLKGTTLAPRLGNRAHRVYETPGGMLNAIGLQNPGARAVVDEILPRLDFHETRFIANVSGSTVEEYEEVTRIFDDSPIDAIEINISCPNVKEGGVTFGNDPGMSARVVEACRRATRKPLITKLSPNQTDIANNAQRCIDAGTDAFAVINTLMGMAIDIDSRRPVIGNNQGGLSGPAIKPIALFKVFQVAQVARPHGIPIIGQGGVTNASDVIEFLLAGATAVGVGTGLFYEPLACPVINQGLLEYLARHGIARVADLTGALEPN